MTQIVSLRCLFHKLLVFAWDSGLCISVDIFSEGKTKDSIENAIKDDQNGSVDQLVLKNHKILSKTKSSYMVSQTVNVGWD